MPASDRHHLLNGSLRKLAEKYGLWVWLCRTCHMKVHRSRELMDEGRKKAQFMFEENYPDLDFLKTFKVNYLDEDDRKERPKKEGYSIEELDL